MICTGCHSLMCFLRPGTSNLGRGEYGRREMEIGERQTYLLSYMKECI